MHLLKEHVLQSDVLLLLQSKGVLERPWCLIEILTALEHGVPIVGVSLLSGAFAYDHAAAHAYLAELDTELERRNPGASELLLEHNFDLTEAAWKLSATLPAIISVGFNPSASKNVLSGMLADVIDEVHDAVPMKLPSREGLPAFLQKRAHAAAAHGSATHHDTAGSASAPAALPPKPPSGATIPPEVPELPAALQRRPALFDALKQSVLTPSAAAASGDASTLEGASSGAATIAANGMGGVGKTIAAVQLIRDREVGSAFERLLFVSVGAEPDVLALLRVLHFQLKSAKMAAEVEEERDAVQTLREAAKGVRALLVLDDVWDSKHAEALNCIDAAAGAVCVITTRIRNIAAAEVSCGLLTAEESLALLLTSAGLEHLIAHPPAAALEAVECCGRLALALPIAGGMIREMEHVWEAELVPCLREELSEELSVEARIVNASLRVIDKGQRAGVDALFEVFACFAEDQVVPLEIIDVLAPLVCARVGVKVSKLKPRKWLASLLKASLLTKSDAGVSAHDLVREVMIARADGPAGGGLQRLQREVLQLLVAAHGADAAGADAASAIVDDFVTSKLHHHVAGAIRKEAAAAAPSAPLHEDALLMGVLAHPVTLVCAQAVKGVGCEALSTLAMAREAAGAWMDAARLWFAFSSYSSRGTAVQLRRSWAALRQAEESDESRLLEVRLLSLLSYMTGEGRLDNAELAEVTERLTSLARQVDGGADPARQYDAKVAEGMGSVFTAVVQAGLVARMPQTAETAAAALEAIVRWTECAHEATAMAPDAVRRFYTLSFGVAFASGWGNLHRTPGFREQMGFFFGEGGAKLREVIEAYDFLKLNSAMKSGQAPTPNCAYLMGLVEPALLLFYGDLRAARIGYRKQADAWRNICQMCTDGERAWSDYTAEEITGVTASAGVLLAAGERALCRDFLAHTMSGVSLREPHVYAEMEKAVGSYTFMWSDDAGYCFSRAETIALRTRALAAVLDDGPPDVEAIRGWLPTPEQLVHICEHELKYNVEYSGAAHPSVVCATVYADKLGAWAEAAATCEGVLALPELEVQPPVRIESWRLLARCRGHQGDAAGATQALDAAVHEAQAVGYVWYEALALKEMLEWVGEEAKPALQARYDAVSAPFKL